MKNYTNSSEESKRFIKNYKVENGQIIAKLASGENYVIPYSEENEKLVLSRMENQARNAINNKYEIKSKIKKYLKWIGMHSALLIPNILIFLLAENPSIFTYIATVSCSLGIITNGLDIVFKQVKLKEIEKMELFLSNTDTFNDNVKKNENILSTISKKTAKQIEQTPVNKSVFDINVIDNISLSDLKILKANIERDESFGFTQEIINTDEKVKKYK